MTYDEVVNVALVYADRRNDPELGAGTMLADGNYPLMNAFMRMVEKRINRVLQTRRQSKRAYIVTSKDKEYYGLPPDFGGLRDIELRTSRESRDRRTLAYVNPEYLNSYVASDNQAPMYCIINNQIQLWPPQDGMILEVIYYQMLPDLTPLKPNNWLSDLAPDVYVQGLLVEVSSFTKDPDSYQLWDSRFTRSLNELEFEDAVDRWSGPALVTRTL